MYKTPFANLVTNIDTLTYLYCIAIHLEYRNISIYRYVSHITKNDPCFFTGADGISLGGYETVIMSFNKDNPYPTASTCGLELTLPTKHDDYNDFKRCLDIAFTMHGGFGLY